MDSLTLIEECIKFQTEANKQIMANELTKEDQGYCLTCKKPLDSVRLCDACAGRRDQGKKMNDFIVKPPQVDTLKDQEKRDERLRNND